MKKELLFLLFIFFTLSLYSQNKAAQTKFTLNGKIKGKNTHIVYLQYFDNADKKVKDSCFVKNGTFTFIGNVKELTRGTLKGT